VSGNRPAYLSYLLRLWHTGADGSWRASIEDPATGRRQGFATLGQLCEYLRVAASSVRPAGVLQDNSPKSETEHREVTTE